MGEGVPDVHGQAEQTGGGLPSHRPVQVRGGQGRGGGGEGGGEGGRGEGEREGEGEPVMFCTRALSTTSDVHDCSKQSGWSSLGGPVFVMYF